MELAICLIENSYQKVFDQNWLHWFLHYFFLRSAELRSLKGRKYLDALCVYFWATTPVLISILVFATYKVVLKKELTAAKVGQQVFAL